MNRLRTHIARVTVAILVMTGFGLYMVQPVQANQSSQAFTNWLSTMTKSSNGLDLQQELDDLRNSGHLGNTIKEASQIISKNNENFEFSFAESIASQHIYQLLLIEWSQFQTDNAMASVPTQHIAKLLMPATIDKAGAHTFTSIGIHTSDANQPVYAKQVISPKTISKNVVPMVGGIAIGAP